MAARPRIGLRLAGPDEAPAVAALLDQLGYPSSVGQVRARLARIAADADGEVLAAIVGGEVPGVTSLHVMHGLEHDAPVGLLTALVVAAPHRRLGVGLGLVRAVEERARARGCGRLVLGTAERRREAHAFYRSAGYVETGRRFARELRARDGA
jgi:GNAT superfamily N-acetyltransferase